MKLSRTDLLPVLTIVAGGVIGGLVSFSFLGQSPAVDMPAPGWQPDTEPPVFVMPAIERGDRIAILRDGQRVIYRDGETGQVYTVRFTDEEQAAFERIEVIEQQLGYMRERVAELLRDGDISN